MDASEAAAVLARARLTGAALLFKVRVLAEELGEREIASLPSQKGI
jgi:hypothetical protein